MTPDDQDFVALDVLEEYDRDPERPERPSRSLSSQRNPLADPDTQVQLLEELELDVSRNGRFDADLADAGWSELTPSELEIVQINLGKLCNMTCAHCHVDAGPDKTEENMDRETVDACLRALDRTDAHTVDLTGGAPELNPNFEYLVDECVDRGKHVIDRCNLTILTVRRYRHLPEWLGARGVEVVCSLPHYRKFNTDAQRGEGTYKKSIEAMRMLNDAGYGFGDSDRKLTLVTNPAGAYLPGDQESLEEEWKEALARNHGVHFDELLTLTNMPIARFLEFLRTEGHLQSYMERLVNAFNPGTIAGLMCRNTLSISWDGRLFDCDFNQMLDIEIETPDDRRPHVEDFGMDLIRGRSIQTGRHCYGCTAGAGSSCGGAIE